MKPVSRAPGIRCGLGFVVLGLVVGCAGRSAVDSAAGGYAGTVSGGGTGAGGAGAGGPGAGGMGGAPAAGASGCPSSPPVAGKPCQVPYRSTEGAKCTYGDDPRPQCRTVASCDAGTWQVTSNACKGPPLPAACLTPPPSDTTACSDPSLACWYGDGTRCWCSGCKYGTEYPICQTVDPPEWYCAKPGAGCPTVMPQAGTPCSAPGASCGPDCTLTITCKDGVWQWGRGQCPICAAPDTPIATPDGERPISSLQVGDLVYSVDHEAIVVVPLLRVGQTRVAQHHVVRVALEGGRVLEISPGHPTADGRAFADLHAGGPLDAEHTVLSAELVPYRYDATYDILPASSTGTYFAAGALIGSTLFRR